MSRDSVKTGPLQLLGDLPRAPLTGVDRTFVDRGLLGRGVAEVHRAYDPRLLRDTALKLMRADRVHPAQLERFTAEVRIAGQLEHPNVVPLYEVGPDGEGGSYASLKLVDGDTLADRLEALGPRRLDPEPLADHVGILIRVCDALAYAHSRGVVHCDLKPSNVLLGAFGQVYVGDWGTAWVSEESDLTVRSYSGEDDSQPPGGTPAWLSPEQARGDSEAVGPATDAFGVGALLYTMLAGQPLYGDLPLAEAVHRAAAGRWEPFPEAVRERAPARLVELCDQALARDPSRRPTVPELQDALERFLRGTWALPLVRHPAGTRVVEEGEEGECAWVVQDGLLRVFTVRDGHELELRTLGRGDVFGELAVLGDGRRTATVEALTDVELLEVPRSSLEEGLGLNRWLGRFVTALATRFQEADEAVRAVRVSKLPEATRREED